MNVSEVNHVALASSETRTISFNYGYIVSDGGTGSYLYHHTKEGTTAYTTSEAPADLAKRIKAEYKMIAVTVEKDGGATLGTPEARWIAGEILSLREVGGKAIIEMQIKPTGLTTEYTCSESQATVYAQVNDLDAYTKEFTLLGTASGIQAAATSWTTSLRCVVDFTDCDGTGTLHFRTDWTDLDMDVRVVDHAETTAYGTESGIAADGLTALALTSLPTSGVADLVVQIQKASGAGTDPKLIGPVLVVNFSNED